MKRLTLLAICVALHLGPSVRGAQPPARDSKPKLVLESADVIELYDLGQDPGEQRNVAAHNPKVVEELVVAFNLWCKDFPRSVSERAKARKR